ncbi:MAG TPA: phosphoglycerate mutase family protein [Thermoplasmata archaeon]|jgi:broad specificity phosphatase PhoE|nr:phosphoglycerate mutase family protein [Thermoplasmata archaeon]
MRVIEHRRHSRREPGDPHLSKEGRALARRVAGTMGRFDRVVTSPKTRAVETAEALGFTVDATFPELAEMPDDAGLSDDVLGSRSFADYVRAVGRSDTVAEYAHRHAELMRQQLLHLADSNGRLLMVSHGGIIELGAAAARPKEARDWGEPLGYLEGVRLYLDRGKWVRGEVLRVSDSRRGLARA